MHEIKDSETVSYTAAQMFNLVADVDRYKEFLPWCTDSHIIRQDDDAWVTEIQVGYAPFHTGFTTRNTHVVNRKIEMDLVDGPFKFLKGSWHFDPIEGNSCRMHLNLNFEFAGHLLDKLFNNVFETAMSSLVRAFKERAKELYDA